MRRFIRKPATYRDDVRVVFRVDPPYTVHEPRRGRSWVDDANEVKSQMMRHIDGVTRHGHNIDVEWDNVCIHCDSDPEASDGTGRPQCCEAAVDLWWQWFCGGYAAPRVALEDE